MQSPQKSRGQLKKWDRLSGSIGLGHRTDDVHKGEGFGRFATVTPFYAAHGRTTLCISIFETYTCHLRTNLWEGGEVTSQACC